MANRYPPFKPSRLAILTPTTRGTRQWGGLEGGGVKEGGEAGDEVRDERVEEGEKRKGGGRARGEEKGTPELALLTQPAGRKSPNPKHSRTFSG